MVADQKIRVLLAKLGLDGHDLGVKIVAQALREAGMEVIFLGQHRTPEPEMVLEVAIQEDVDVIGVSALSGQQLTLVPRLMELIKEAGSDLAHVLVVVGGISPKEDIPLLKAAGVHGVFMGTLAKPAVDFIEDNVARVRQAAGRY